MVPIRHHRRNPDQDLDRGERPRDTGCWDDAELGHVSTLRLTSGLQLVVDGVGALILVAALYVGGGMLLAYATPFLLICAALAWVGIGGRKTAAMVGPRNRGRHDP